MAAPVYRFLPWARRGLAQGVSNADTGAALPARTATKVNLTVAGKPAAADVTLYGPGEVTGIDHRQILRTEPAPGATDFEPNYLAAIEFDPPDLPWLFSPAAQRNGRLRPWCVLAVVEKRADVTVSVRTDAPLPVLTIGSGASRELPDLTESWAWAHAQILEEQGSPTADLDADPDRNLSRLICPRRLKPETGYIACVVPAFDLGVARGLGLAPSAAEAKPAWSAGVADISLPLYYFWEFATAVADDIETMARRLHGPERAPQNLGRRRIWAAAGHRDLTALPPAARAITMHGALRPARQANAPEPDPVQPAALTNRLGAIVARRNTSELPAPLYGEWPAAKHTLADAPAWMNELNATVGHRIAAALGTEVVRRHQEAFVDAAWRQAGQAREGQELAQRGRLSATVLERLIARHFATRSPDRLLALAGPALSALSVAPGSQGAQLRTIAATLQSASAPAGATSAAYRRLASGQRQAVKLSSQRARLDPRAGVLALTAGRPALVEPAPGPPDGVTGLRDLKHLQHQSGSTVSLASLGLAGSTTPTEVAKLVPLTKRVGSLPTADRPFFPASQLEAVVFQVTGRSLSSGGSFAAVPRPVPVTEAPAVTAFQGALAQAAAVANRPTVEAAFVHTDIVALGRRLLSRLDARSNVARRVASMVGVADEGGAFDPLEGIQMFPVIGDSTYQYLDELPGSWVLPQASGLEADTAILLRTNRRFTDAFLVGLNHEMNSELLWRGYPTDQRGTPFQHFWDRFDDRPDILPIHRWNPAAPLGVAGEPPVLGPSSATGDQVVLLLRGDLLRRYPDLVVYATRGTRTEPGTTIPAAGRPMFFASLKPDITLVGFPLTTGELASGEWWFVLEQQLTAPRFGFDEGPPPPPPPPPAEASWSDATWSMFDVEAGAHIKATSGPIATTVIGRRGFGSTADAIASSLLQRPIQVALHRDRLLLKEESG